MAEPWVVNASPFIVLAKIQHLDLLDDVDRELWLPAAVADEIAAGPEHDPARTAVASWSARRVVVKVADEILEWGLGAGESGVITLARERQGRAVLDDAEARACARTLGVPVIGTLGVILRAKTAGRIVAAAPIIARLREVGLHLNESVVREALASIGES